MKKNKIYEKFGVIVLAIILFLALLMMIGRVVGGCLYSMKKGIIKVFSFIQKHVSKESVVTKIKDTQTAIYTSKWTECVLILVLAGIFLGMTVILMLPLGFLYGHLTRIEYFQNIDNPFLDLLIVMAIYCIIALLFRILLKKLYTYAKAEPENELRKRLLAAVNMYRKSLKKLEKMLVPIFNSRPATFIIHSKLRILILEFLEMLGGKYIDNGEEDNNKENKDDIKKSGKE